MPAKAKADIQSFAKNWVPASAGTSGEVYISNGGFSPSGSGSSNALSVTETSP
jgi:hypothetical protein